MASRANYSPQLSGLVLAEEKYQQDDLAKYKLKRAHIFAVVSASGKGKKNKKETVVFLGIEMPGLPEGRPNVTVGGNVRVRDDASEDQIISTRNFRVKKLLICGLR